MEANNLELLVEEPSMEAFLQVLLPRILPPGWTFRIHAFQGKSDLLSKLEARLRSYATWLPAGWRLFVVVDRDNDDCHVLKERMEDIAERAGLRSKTRTREFAWQIVNRVAIEELEAWYFGNWEAVRAAYPRVSSSLPTKERYRDPDAITGGTWETFEKVMQYYGYFKGGLPKIDVAREIASHIDPERSRSQSFTTFQKALIEAVQ